MSTLIDDLLSAELPDKVTIKYKPSRMRKLLKQLAELIVVQNRIVRFDFSVGLATPQVPISLRNVAGIASVVKAIVFQREGILNPISATDTIKFLCNGITLYDGEFTGAMVVSGDPAIEFLETDMVDISVESDTVNEHSIRIAVILEEVN